MSDTAHVTHQLSEYLDHALPAPEQRAVEKHLEQCRECSARYKELQHLRQRLKTAPALTPPESFYRGVLERIEQDKKPFLIWDWPVATKAIATFGVVMVMVMVAREARRSEPELFAPVSEVATPEASPAAAPSPAPPTGVPAVVSQPAAPASPAGAPMVAHAEFGALEKKADISNAKSVESTNKPAALKQKALRKTGAASSFSGADEEREKEGDQLAPASRQTNAGMDDKNGALSGGGGALASRMAPAPMDTAAAGNVTLQARDIKGAVTQGSFSEGQQQFAAKKETVAALSTTRSEAASHAATEWKGDFSAISSFRTVVITTDADWKALWAEHTQNQVSPPPVPDVDFSRFIVVGVFAGNHPDLQGIAIQNIQTASDGSTVLYKEVPLAPTEGLAAPANRPYHLKRISKSALPVTFTQQP